MSDYMSRSSRILSLPPELITQIAGYLRKRDLSQFSLACRAFRCFIVPILFRRIRVFDCKETISNLQELLENIELVRKVTRHISIKQHKGFLGRKSQTYQQITLLQGLTSMSVRIKDRNSFSHTLEDLRQLITCIADTPLKSVWLSLTARPQPNFHRPPRSLPPLPPLRSLVIDWDVVNLPNKPTFYIAALIARSKETLTSFIWTIDCMPYVTEDDLVTILDLMPNLSRLSITGRAVVIYPYSADSLWISLSRLSQLEVFHLTFEIEEVADITLLPQATQDLSKSCLKLATGSWSFFGDLSCSFEIHRDASGPAVKVISDESAGLFEALGSSLFS